jgi:hypothetical protein
MMKKAILLTCALLMMTGVAFGGLLSEDPGELHGSLQVWVPGDGDFDLFKTGYGLTVEYREWFSFPWGVGVSLGLDSWQVNSSSQALKYDQLTRYDGDATLIPLGASLYFNAIDWDYWNVIFGTGFQYLIVNSDVSVYSETDERRYDVDMDDAILWNINASYEYMLGENLYVLGGVGYQIDLMRSGTSYNGLDSRDMSFRGFFVRAGAKYLF